ncbi:MAG: hypothetical protein IIC00_10510, partial [Planctomycetes bacterium]|nr:hypothetical protein [Planctomycetota bacterium]
WSLRHVNNLLRGKLCATVVTYLSPDAADNVNQSLAIELEEMERMELIGRREFIGAIAGGMAAGGAYHEKIQTPIVGRHDVIVCGSTGGQRQNPPTPAQCQTVTEIALEPER